MTDFFTFKGTPPIDCYPPAPLKPEQVLAIMEQQLKVLANMTARTMLVPAGTQITPLDLSAGGLPVSYMAPNGGWKQDGKRWQAWISGEGAMTISEEMPPPRRAHPKDTWVRYWVYQGEKVEDEP